MADRAERETTKCGVTSNFCTRKRPPLKKTSTIPLFPSTCGTTGLHRSFPVRSPRFVEMPSPTLYPFLPLYGSLVPPPISLKLPFPRKNHSSEEGPPLLPSKAHFLASPAAERSGPPCTYCFQPHQGQRLGTGTGPKPGPGQGLGLEPRPESEPRPGPGSRPRPEPNPGPALGPEPSPGSGSGPGPGPPPPSPGAAAPPPPYSP